VAIAEEVADDVGAVSDDDEEALDAGGREALEDVEKDGLAADLDHGLWEIVGELAHAGAAASGEEDGFVDGGHGEIADC